VVTCPKCQKNDHTLENCWRDEICDVCGIKGHIAKVCSQRPKDGAPATKSSQSCSAGTKTVTAQSGDQDIAGAYPYL
jgi:hypothetical protein